MSVLWIEFPIEDPPDVPDVLVPYVTVDSSAVDVRGDRASARDVYVWHTTDAVAISTDLSSLLDAITARGFTIRLDDFGVSAFLHDALVPLTRTAYRDLHLLAAGDALELAVVDGAVRASVSLDYPWMESNSRGDEEPDPDRLLELLTAGTVSQLAEAGNTGVLMLSSGLDSPSVALAVAEAGLRDVRAVTYRWGPDDPEPPVAASICRRLGLDHRIVDIPTDRDDVRDLLVRFFERSPLPGTDQSQIPYLVALDAVDDPHGAVLDGGGNDAYMSYFPSARATRKLRYHIPVRALRRLVARVAPVSSRINYLARSRAEATFPGRNLRQPHVERLYRDAADIAGWWDDLSAETAHLSDADLFDLVLRRQLHAPQVLLKQKLASSVYGLEPLLPWCAPEVADYYFNLPQASKFDVAGDKDKSLVREMLAIHLDYDADAIGKHYFVFDGAAFLRRHEELVRDEITSSPLWDPDGVRMVMGWLARMDRRPMLWHAVLTVFMISGWSNHHPVAARAARAG